MYWCCDTPFRLHLGCFLMVTQQLLSLSETIVNKGNIFGIDRRTFQVYVGASLINDNEPDLLINLDPYIVLGGFIETFLECLAGQKIRFDEKNIHSAYSNFSDNIKEFESEILSHTKRYIDEANSLGSALRKLGYKVRFLVSERTDGIDVYLLGRTELLRAHVSQKINEWLSEGITAVLMTCPFEYALYKDRFLPQHGTQNIQLKFPPDLIETSKSVLLLPNSIEAALVEPYEAPIELLPLSIRGSVIANIERIKAIFRNVKNLSIKGNRTKDCPFSYEQILFLNPLISIELAAQILRNLSNFDAIMTLRTLTASILRVAARLSNIDVEIYDYIEMLSSAILEGSILE